MSYIKGPFFRGTNNRLNEVEHQLKAAQEQRAKELRELYGVLNIYKRILLYSGLIENCEANRTEYEWVNSDTYSLPHNFHFKVNKVVKQK